MLNSISIMARLCHEPELKKTPDGVSVCTIRVACERDVPSSDGHRASDFFDIVCWRGTADFVASHFSKGKTICVVGRLQSREYNTKENVKRTATEIVAEHVSFGGEKIAAARPADVSAEDFSDGNLETLTEVDNDLPF